MLHGLGKVKKEGCKAFKFYWGGDKPLIYLSNEKKLPKLLQPNKLAMQIYVFYLDVQLILANAFMNCVPCKQISKLQPVPMDTTLISEMSVKDFYEKKDMNLLKWMLTYLKTNHCSAV